MYIQNNSDNSKGFWSIISVCGVQVCGVQVKEAMHAHMGNTELILSMHANMGDHDEAYMI